jgi:peptidoglycan/LPS O-acetylase OafA/YrhL
VGLVIASHAGINRLDGGFIGVDVFFVISGFLITGLLLREHERTGRISIADFYVRRARRILPAATLVILVVLAFAAVLLPQTALTPAVADAGWAAVFLANWRFAAVGMDYFASPDPSLLQHYWSLAVEEQFYLVWPLLALLLLPRMSRRGFAIAAAVVAALSLTWSLFFTSANAGEAYFNTPARAYELAAGALLACFLTSPLGGKLTRNVLAVGGAVLILVAALALDEGQPFPGWQALLPVLGTVALLAAGPRTAVGSVLSWGPIRYIGDISYSLYLWHRPALLLAPLYLPESWPHWSKMLVAGGIAFVLSVLTYHGVEQLFQQKRVPVLTRGRLALVLWPLSLALVAAGSFSSVGYADARQDAQTAQAQEWLESHGAFDVPETVVDAQPVLREALDLADAGAPIPPAIDPSALKEGGWQQFAAGGCYANDGKTSIPKDDCVFGDPDAEHVVALVGDSHAVMWIRALDAIGKDQGFQVRIVAKLSCAPYPIFQEVGHMPQAECDAFREWAQQHLHDLAPDTIVVTARGQLNMRDDASGSVDEQWSAAVTGRLEERRGLTTDVRVLGDVPPRPTPADCLTAVDAIQATCVTSSDSREIRSNALTREAAEAVGARYVEVTPLVCVDGRCPLVVGDTVLYEDGSHLTGDWTRRVWRAMADLLGPIP